MAVIGAREQVLEDPHAGAAYRWRGSIVDPVLGLCDAAGASPEAALARARRRYRRRWLGVEWPGSTLPVDAEDPARGQIARDGFRFALWRRIGDGDGLVCWIMLNPSTANHNMDDATLWRITRYSRDWGYGWLTVGNLWPYRATNPEDLRRWIEDGHHRVGHALDDNDRRVCTMARRADLVVAAWGAPGNWERRAREVRAQLAAAGVELHALAMTRGGEPSHPLRLPATLRPMAIAGLGAQRAA